MKLTSTRDVYIMNREEYSFRRLVLPTKPEGEEFRNYIPGKIQDLSKKDVRFAPPIDASWLTHPQQWTL